jgi:hypothetical protein
VPKRGPGRHPRTGEPPITSPLFLLLGGGTAVAASQLGKESVGTNQLKKAAVTPAKLSAAAKAGMQGPAGPQVQQGAKGATGARGATGAQGPRGETGAKGDTGTKGDPSLERQRQRPHLQPWVL